MIDFLQLAALLVLLYLGMLAGVVAGTYWDEYRTTRQSTATRRR